LVIVDLTPLDIRDDLLDIYYNYDGEYLYPDEVIKSLEYDSQAVLDEIAWLVENYYLREMDTAFGPCHRLTPETVDWLEERNADGYCEYDADD